MKTTVLLDGDVVAYKFASAGQTKIDWGDGTVSYDVADKKDVFSDCQRYILEIEEMLGADETVVCLSCPTPEKWRVKLWPQYTSRKTEKPVLLQDVKDFMASRFPSYARPTLEADDIMGILSTHPRIIPGKKIIVSIDKDMKTIPGWLFNPDKDDFAREISPDEADYWWMYQTLTGDSVDCYPGCPGVGPKNASKLLDGLWGDSDDGPFFPLPLVWPHVVGMYGSRDLTEADALLQARLARILRHTDYDFKKKEVKLWTP